jgi:excisionase family DNA binding protein
MEQLKIEIPNPEDWCDVELAAEVLGRSRANVYDMIKRGVLKQYKVGRITMLWRPDVTKVSLALRVLETRK